jgi:hydrogenase maturation protease
MSRDLIDKIARAVLYEGYILYPYRPCVKSQQRWTFGGLYPPAWTNIQRAGDPSFMRTECLVTGDRSSSLQVSVRFLHLIDRTVGKITERVVAWSDEVEPMYEPVDSLRIGEVQHHPWQEAADREVDVPAFSLGDLLESPRELKFDFPASRTLEPLRQDAGMVAGVLIRQQQAVDGLVELSAVELEPALFKVIVTIRNRTAIELGGDTNRDDVLMRSLVSTHAILTVSGGEFVSQTDPPQKWKARAAACQNVGNWPVLVGTEPARDTVLASPIILYDYPQIAPESPGDLFDATEIDEILSLRILTLTDDEKRAAAGVDSKARDLLARTESLAREQLMGLHGTMRGMKPVGQEQSHA